MHRTAFFSVILCSAMFRTAVGAGEDNKIEAGTGDPIELDKLEVTASPFRFHSDLELAQPADVLYGDQLMLRSQSTLGETVDQQLGVTASDFNPVGASRPVIRGLGGQRVRVLENGGSVMDVSDISVDHAVAIEPVLSRQIEVLRGPSTLMYGSGAIGGVVNVVNNRIPDRLPDTIEGAFEGRFNSATTERTGAFRITGAVGDFALHGDGMYLKTDDYDAAVGTIPNSSVEIGQWSAGGSYIGERGWVGISVSQLYDQYEIPVLPGDNEAPFIDLEQTRVNLKSRLDDPFSGFSGLNFNFAWGDYEHTEFENPGEIGTQFENDEFNTGVQLEHESFANWLGAIGVQGGTRDLSAIGEEAFIPRTKIWNIGGFIVEERDFGDWHVELGARVEHKNYDPEQLRPSRNFTPYTLSAGSRWTFTPGYNISVNLARAQRAPQVQELYAQGTHVATQTFEFGNPDLQEETSNNIDLSFNKTDGDWTWSLGAFYNFYQDYIFLQEIDSNGDGLPDFVDEDGILDPNGPFLLVFDRQRDAHFYGVEAEMKYQFMENDWGRMNGRVWGDFVRAKFTNGRNVPRISPWRIGGNLEYGYGRWQTGVDIFYVGEQDKTAVLETTTPGYTMININAVYTLPTESADIAFFVRGTNLLNEDARRSTSFLKDVAPLPGRAATVGVRTTF